MAAFTIASEPQNTASGVKQLYNYLTDFANFKNILPEDKVENFVPAAETCSFTIKGITAITIRRTSATPFSEIIFESEGLAKFNFRLRVTFTESGAQGSCQVEMFADMNPFIKAMAEKPLTQLVNTMAAKLSQLRVDGQP